MTIRLALAKDIRDLDKILKQAALRIKKKQSTQWSDVLANKEYNNLVEHVSKNEVYVYLFENEIIGLCYLYEGRAAWDLTLWEEAESAYYLHKLALKDNYTGKGFAAQFLNELINLVLDKKGIIRLDCMANKEMLNKLYQSVGFEYVDTIKKSKQPTLPADFNLYEKR